MTSADSLLDHWLSTVMDPAKLGRPVNLNDMRFPSDEARGIFLRSIRSYDEEVVVAVLDRLLIQNVHLPGVDLIFWEGNRDIDLEEAIEDLSEEEQERILSFQKGPRYVRIWRRIQGSEYPTWEGLTWVRNLLPSRPKLAIEILDGYLKAHWDLMDAWIWATTDAQAVIQARYIGAPEDFEDRRALLYRLTSRQFEHIAVNLYNAMGYVVTATPTSHDGGIDGKGLWPMLGRSEKIILQSRRYKKTLGPNHVRELAGVVFRERANRGILIAASDFSEVARQEAEDCGISLVNGTELAVLLNAYAGYAWPQHINYWTRDPADDQRRRTEALQLIAQRLELEDVNLVAKLLGLDDEAEI